MEESAEDDQTENEWVHGIRGKISEIRHYLTVTRSQEIIRRYFAMNAFDGSMTSLGVVMGAMLGKMNEPRSIIGVIITSAIGMLVSGFSGTYMTESAERSHSLNELEEAMLINLDNTVYGKAGKVVPVFAAIVDGTAPFIAAIPSVIPFLLVPLIFGIDTAYIISILASLVTLFTLGVYLGRISGENILISGVKMVVSGIVVAIIALILGH